MKPPPFSYARPDTLDEVLGMLAEYGDAAKVLAGGQSLVPALNFRLARPDVLIDLGGVDELRSLSFEDGSVSIGAAVTQRTVEKSTEVAAACPLLVQALGYVGHIQNRNRRTVVGSMAHADPAAELPAVAVALDADLVLRSTAGIRTVAASDFLLGAFTTAVRPDEIVVAVRFPATSPASTAADEISSRMGDFAIAGVAGKLTLDGEGRVSDVALALFGVAGHALRLDDAEEYLQGRPIDSGTLAEVAQLARTSVGTGYGDVHADGDYRARVSGELTARALVEMAA